MSPFFSNRRLIALLVSLIFLVGIIGYSMSEQRSLSSPEQFIQDSVGVAQSVFTRPAYWASNAMDTIGDIRNVYEENQALKAQLDSHAAVLVERNELERRNEELEDAMELRNGLNDYTVYPAMIIQRSPDRWDEMVGINKGAQDGIAEEMAVITSSGLVGKVREVSQFSATVQLLSNQNAANRISAVADTGSGVYGFIEGIDEESGNLRFTKIDMEAELEAGQTVSSSGLGGIFPSGLTIGEITEVEEDEYGLSQTALVEPAADMQSLDYVMVLERESGSLDEEIEEEEPDIPEELDEEESGAGESEE
jgi:rod shape-determining protein MreC